MFLFQLLSPNGISTGVLVCVRVCLIIVSGERLPFLNHPTPHPLLLNFPQHLPVFIFSSMVFVMLTSLPLSFLYCLGARHLHKLNYLGFLRILCLLHKSHSQAQSIALLIPRSFPLLLLDF